MFARVLILLLLFASHKLMTVADALASATGINWGEGDNFLPPQLHEAYEAGFVDGVDQGEAQAQAWGVPCECECESNEWDEAAAREAVIHVLDSGVSWDFSSREEILDAVGQAQADRLRALNETATTPLVIID